MGWFNFHLTEENWSSFIFRAKKRVVSGLENLSYTKVGFIEFTDFVKPYVTPVKLKERNNEKLKKFLIEDIDEFEVEKTVKKEGSHNKEFWANLAKTKKKKKKEAFVIVEGENREGDDTINIKTNSSLLNYNIEIPGVESIKMSQFLKYQVEQIAEAEKENEEDTDDFFSNDLKLNLENLKNSQLDVDFTEYDDTRRESNQKRNPFKVGNFTRRINFSKEKLKIDKEEEEEKKLSPPLLTGHSPTSNIISPIKMNNPITPFNHISAQIRENKPKEQIRKKLNLPSEKKRNPFLIRNICSSKRIILEEKSFEEKESVNEKINYADYHDLSTCEAPWLYYSSKDKEFKCGDDVDSKYFKYYMSVRDEAETLFDYDTNEMPNTDR